MSYKKRNWPKYNKSLINRGSLTFWIHKDALKTWKASRMPKKCGRPFIFSDTAIQTALTIRFAYNLTLRAVEGFLQSLFKMLNIELEIPCYTQICKRMKKMPLSNHFLIHKSVKHVVVDTTGLKVYGEGEWKVKKHGASKRRIWRKMHISVDEKTQDILFVDITKEHASDTTFLPEIMKRRKGIKKLLMDGAADSLNMYKLAWQTGITLLTPPKRTARKRKEPWLQDRNERFLQILGLGGGKSGKSLWGKLSGYSCRATIESAIARWKRLYGAFLKSRTDERQRNEVYLKGLMLNIMRSLECNQV